MPPGAATLDIERGRLDSLREEKWLTDTSIDNKAWCYISNPKYKSADDLIDILVDIVSKNGNLLLNIGPRADGTIPEEQKDRLLTVGEWLKINGEAIYGTRPWKVYGEGPTTIKGGYFGEKETIAYTNKDIRFTIKGNTLFAICLDWPHDEVVIHSLKNLDPNQIKSINLLGTDEELPWSSNEVGLLVKLPPESPSQFAHTIKITLTELEQAKERAIDNAIKMKNDKAFVYVANYGDSTISKFVLDKADGNLFRRGITKVGKQPGPITVNQDGSILYATLRGENSVAAYAINPKNGELSLLRRTEVSGNPAYVSLDRSDKYLFTVYYGDEKIAVHEIQNDGTVANKPVQVLSTAKNPHAILSDYSNSYVFVPHTGANSIFQYLFDKETGRLTANRLPYINPKMPLQPRHLYFHPNNKWVFMSDEKGCSISSYELISDDGTLRALQTLSTLPDDFEGQNTCADIEVHPSGKFVYVSNRGHNSIAGFAIDEKSGRLTPIGFTITEHTPRSFNIDSSGRFLLAAGQKTNTLVSYKINTVSGELQKIYVYPVGKNPSWIEIVTPDYE
jgi:6-phosphogluconolactonase